jgi:hypothetical protein
MRLGMIIPVSPFIPQDPGIVYLSFVPIGAASLIGDCRFMLRIANGDTTWSSSPSLAYVNSDNQAIIKVDNSTSISPVPTALSIYSIPSSVTMLILSTCMIASTVPYNEKRDSVKLLSQNWYKAGTVFIMDAVQYVPLFSFRHRFAFIFLHLFRGLYRWADHELLFCLCCSIFASAITPIVWFVCDFMVSANLACRLDVVSGQVSPPFPPPTQLNLK